MFTMIFTKNSTVETGKFETTHEAKSFAGKNFHRDDVDAVIVTNNESKAIFSLEKSAKGVVRNGHVRND